MSSDLVSLMGDTLTSKAGSVNTADALAGKTVALYFSAHWCPPCRGFTPKFAEWYTKDLQAKGLEVVFVSSDRDEDAFNDYYKEMPWLALPFADRDQKTLLSDKYGVSGIPSVVILNADGAVITKDGRSAISGDPTGTSFPWIPKPVKDLKNGPGTINQVPTVLAFCETGDAEAKAEAEAAMLPVAKQFLAEAKAAGQDEPAIAFCMVTESSGLAPQLRSMFKMDALPPAQHEHPLEKCDKGSGWGCDGCGGDGGDKKERYRCTKGCDHDYCGDCHAAAGKPVGEILSKLVLCDIPNDGGYYSGPAGPITADSIAKFVADYKSKSLERAQLA